jgi:hypothetical protein
MLIDLKGAPIDPTSQKLGLTEFVPLPCSTLFPIACLIGSYLSTSYRMFRDCGASKHTSVVEILVLDLTSDRM